MDEKQITLPKLGVVEAKAGFAVLATQNPREFTATHALSEALLDRFEMIRLDYQSRQDELYIVTSQMSQLADEVAERAIDLIRSTRNHPSIKRGASVRAALAIGKLVEGGLDYQTACLMALPSRIEMISSEEDPREIILQLISSAPLPGLGEKKKNVKK